MTATAQKSWYRFYAKFKANRQTAWAPKIYKEIKYMVQAAADSVQKNGAKYTADNIHGIVVSAYLSSIIKAIYLDAGVVFGGRAYQLVKKQIKTKEQKRLTPIGHNQQLIDEITRYFELELLNEAVLPITQTTQDYVLRILTESQNEGVSINDIVDKLVGNTELLKNRARLIARTEMQKAANYGAVASVSKLGYQTNKIWISAQDNRTRRVPRDEADHLHANGQTVPINQPFKIRDLKTGGYVDMMQPGDAKGGAENVINCRCVVGFDVVTDERGVPVGA